MPTRRWRWRHLSQLKSTFKSSSLYSVQFIIINQYLLKNFLNFRKVSQTFMWLKASHICFHSIPTADISSVSRQTNPLKLHNIRMFITCVTWISLSYHDKKQTWEWNVRKDIKQKPFYGTCTYQRCPRDETLIICK